MVSNFHRKSSWYELLLIIAATILSVAAAHYYDFLEKFYQVSRLYENYQLDELSAAFITLTFGLAIFAFRRWRDLVREQSALKQVMARNELLIAELREAAEKIKILSGLLPICSYCKKIRDDQGYWQQLEKYISEHSEAVFSHGICPSCRKEHFAELP
jgi:hypothetical protein